MLQANIFIYMKIKVFNSWSEIGWECIDKNGVEMFTADFHYASTIRSMYEKKFFWVMLWKSYELDWGEHVRGCVQINVYASAL